MALIICPDCGGKVSDKANACIHCGCPMESGKSELKRLNSIFLQRQTQKENSLLNLKLPLGWYFK